MPWDPPVIETDTDVVTDRILDGLTERLAGYDPVEGDPLVALAEELGKEIALLNSRTIDAVNLAHAGFGETGFRFPAVTAAEATLDVDLTLDATAAVAGVIIPAGLTVVGVNPDGVEVAFQLPADVATTDPVTTVSMTAVLTGAASNGVAIGDALTIVTATVTVLSAQAATESTGGADAETVTEYLDRLVDYLGTLRPGGVNAADLAALARSVPGVHRALAVDLYDPADPLTPTERTVTVFPVDETSHPVDTAVADQVQAVLEAAREVNFIVHVADPTYTTVDIVFEAGAEAGADPAAVLIEIEAALTDWLTSWGTTALDDQAWEAKNTVRFLDAIRVAGNAPGVGYLTSLTINGVAGDLALDGAAALPTPFDDPTDPSTVTGTVV